jgi:hypothetical protein
VTDNAQAVLQFLVKGWKLRVGRKGRWLLKQSDFISNYEECPGGQTTIAELVRLSYIDANNNITAGGRAALAAKGEAAP